MPHLFSHSKAIAPAGPARSPLWLRLSGRGYHYLIGVGVLTLSACSSTPVPILRASPPTIYLQSLRAFQPVADCLADRLPASRATHREDGVEIAVDGRKWLIEVSPTESGRTLISGHRGRGGDDIEPAVRFAIARCTL